MYEIESPRAFVRTPTLGFIGDLHFDHVDMMSPRDAENLFLWCMEMEVMRQPTFILCVTGDVYDDIERTLAFIKRLEKAKIPGFFVLGNHDYFKGRGPLRTVYETMSYVQAETAGHEYFRVLMTGRCYVVGGVTFIGDTGWTSFENDNHELMSMVDLPIPDIGQVAGLTRDSVRDLHDEWVNYASVVLREAPNVVVLTHFPMCQLSRNASPQVSDVWWSSNTRLGSSEFSDCVFIFGHTHPRGGLQKSGNHISTQVGYWSNRYDVSGERNYTPVYDVGVLVPKAKTVSDVALRDDSYLSSYVDFVSGSALVGGAISDSPCVARLRRSLSAQGYRRVVANREILQAIAEDSDTYVSEVRSALRSFVEPLSKHYDVLRGFDVPSHSGNALFEACDIIERRDVSNIQAYVTAIVMTGYVYNNVFSAFDEANPNHVIRPVHDYDVFRFWLVLISVSARGKDFPNESSFMFYSARASRKRAVEINGLAVPTPVLDDEYEIPTPMLIAAMAQAGLVVSSDVVRKNGRDCYVVGGNRFFLEGGV